MKTFAVALLVALSSRDAFAQSAGKTAYRWSITLAGAVASVGPTSDLEDAMRRSGYDSKECGIVGCNDDPRSTITALDRGPNFVPTLSYALTPRVGLSLTGSSTRLGSTSGANDVVDVGVGLEASTVHVAALVSWTNEVLRIGVGPAWYRNELRDVGADRKVSKSSLGYLVEAGLTFPRRTRLFADFSVQYRGMGSSDFGAYTPPPQLTPASAPIDLNGINFSHWSIAAGMGVRL